MEASTAARRAGSRPPSRAAMTAVSKKRRMSLTSVKCGRNGTSAAVSSSGSATASTNDITVAVSRRRARRRSPAMGPVCRGEEVSPYRGEYHCTDDCGREPDRVARGERQYAVPVLDESSDPGPRHQAGERRELPPQAATRGTGEDHEGEHHGDRPGAGEMPADECEDEERLDGAEPDSGVITQPPNGKGGITGPRQHPDARGHVSIEPRLGAADGAPDGILTRNAKPLTTPMRASRRRR